MTKLPNGCWCSPLSVHPKNWKTLQASVKKNWYIHYKFYDPAFKNDPKYKYGKLVIIKAGINNLATRSERKLFAEKLIAVEMDLLLNDGYNQITGKYSPAVNKSLLLAKNTPLVNALIIAMEAKQCTNETRLDMKSMIKYVGAAAKTLEYDIIPVCEIKRIHIRAILDQCGIDKATWNAARYNRYRSYLIGLFDELMELEAVDFNPARDLKKKPVTKKIRSVLTPEQVVSIDRHLKRKKLNRFRLFIRIFFSSGARVIELLNVKGSQVNLKEQYFIATIKKGSVRMEVKKTIRTSALRYWKMAMQNCASDQYLFSEDLKPGNKSITRPMITRRWEMHIKNPIDKGGLNIPVDFYAYKHLNTTKTAKKYGDHAAAAQNSHTTTAMVVNIYDLKNKERNHEELKKVNVSLM